MRQQTLCELQKNVGYLQQRLRHSEAHAHALDERLMVLDARQTPLATNVESAPVAAGVKAFEAMGEEGVSMAAGQSLVAQRSLPLPNISTGDRPRLLAQPLPKAVQQALRAYRRGAFRQAFEQLDSFVRQHPQHAAADRARFWMGECQYEQGALTQSIAQFSRLEREHPKSPKTPEALLKMALAFERLAAPDAASKTLRRLIQSFPKSASAELAMARLTKPAPRGEASQGQT